MTSFTTFSANTLAESALVNANLTRLPPIGAVVAWLKSFTNTPALPDGWVECDGSVLSDAESVYNGETIPDLNATAGTARFLRGATASGAESGSETHTHTLTGTKWDQSGGDSGSGTTNATSTLPSYHSVVWIMRVK